MSSAVSAYNHDAIKPSQNVVLPKLAINEPARSKQFTLLLGIDYNAVLMQV